ncbi:nucleotidyltransferase family protein [Lutibacter sp. TH_r2]|uniref:nucleotidyltransferase family protein n=1 Tax=Lutibacter sp. TH_r2 TaxID=3082083 RepID=UPI00295520C4|nr:nucleotidyltransferase family protein [Lutibacter sp. TH_r2]MDV7186835.1 nucleotidyltransferase family protein [Lutibacter sp. TH_r2]
MKANIAILILAAGSSSRMGKPKQLLKWRNTTLLGNIIEQSLQVNSANVCVVLGANSEEIKSKLNFKNTTIIQNCKWKLGMGTSISCGIEFIQKKFPNCNSVLITLSDQPYINSCYFKTLINEFNATSKKIVATKTENRISVPAIFDACYFEELKKLKENKGAKDILKKHVGNVKKITSKINFIDIDTAQDYQLIKD